MPGQLLQVIDLQVEFHHQGDIIRACQAVSMTVAQGEILGLVGESGSGKSVLCRTILRLLPSPPARVRGGRILFEGEDLLRVTDPRIRDIRGTVIAMVFQNPMTSLNPVWPIGDQVTEGLRVHQGLSARAARGAGVELLWRAGIANPDQRYDEYPHQWSGGMLQRAAIAMAMAGAPKLLLADEPTTALDVTIQDQLLALLLELQERNRMAMVLVSHDMAVVAETCDRVAVMYAGRIVEIATTKALFTTPQHPYTWSLIHSIPRLDEASQRLDPIPGQPPNLAEAVAGCPFAPRCRFASKECFHTPIVLREVAYRHDSACLFPERIG